jgi:hypothetical protein
MGDARPSAGNGGGMLEASMTSSLGHPNICVDATSIEPANIVIVIEPEASTVERKLLQDQLGY